MRTSKTFMAMSVLLLHGVSLAACYSYYSDRCTGLSDRWCSRFAGQSACNSGDGRSVESRWFCTTVSGEGYTNCGPASAGSLVCYSVYDCIWRFNGGDYSCVSDDDTLVHSYTPPLELSGKCCP